MFLQIPYNPSRDMNDAQVREINGNEWLRYGDGLWQPLSGVATLPTQSAAPIVIGSEGFSEWRSLSGTTALTFNVSMTGTDARWAAFDANFTFTADSLCGDATKLTVPAGGYVQFLGASGATFTVATAEALPDK
jgi:hypothetical protein